jgi:phospholipid/cholesterol/gamma-HCH transport system substrate-binding protein
MSVAIVIFLMLLMSGSTGGLFAPKLVLRSYFDNASGLKNGAPVTLEGVTIGNVMRIRVVPERSPKPVEVSMRIGDKFAPFLHVDSTTVIAQAGVLGDSFVDITSKKATGPAPPNNSELKSVETPSIQEVVNSSAVALNQITGLMGKIDILFDTLNSKKGTAGKLMNDPALYDHLAKVTANLEIITRSMAGGEGTLGKLIHDDTLYQKLNASVERLSNITVALDEGKGTAGKLLKDDSLYHNLNEAVANTNQLVANINAGKGALGKLATDQEFANRLRYCDEPRPVAEGDQRWRHIGQWRKPVSLRSCRSDDGSGPATGQAIREIRRSAR